MSRLNTGKFADAKSRITLNTGEVIRMLRELKGWTQKELSRKSGLTTSNISLLETSRIEIGKRRAEQLAKAFAVHPAIIMFPEYESMDVLRAA